MKKAKLFNKMNVKLSNEQWQTRLPMRKTFPAVRLGAGRQVCRFLQLVLWITSSGAQWRLLLKQPRSPNCAALRRQIFELTNQFR